MLNELPVISTHLSALWCGVLVGAVRTGRPLKEELKKVESLKQDAQVESLKAEPMTV